MNDKFDTIFNELLSRIYNDKEYLIEKPTDTVKDKTTNKTYKKTRLFGNMKQKNIQKPKKGGAYSRKRKHKYMDEDI